jgi:molecular chaperone GrpE
MNEKETKPNEEEKKEGEGVGAVEEELNKLRQELDSVQEEKDELFSRLQRVYADFSNFQKRVPKNIADAVTYEKEKLIRSFLPVLDNFALTLQKAHAAESVDAVVKAVEMIHGQMLNVLKLQGVEPIQAVGEKFDPERHEAIVRRAEPDKENDLVLEEFQKGYVLNHHILRPSRVAVNKVETTTGPAASSERRAAQQPQESTEAASEQGTDAVEPASEQESDSE